MRSWEPFRVYHYRAGVIIGFVGTCGWGIVWAFASAVILAALGIGLFLSQSERFDITRDMVVITAKVEHYKDTHDRVAPAGLEILNLDRATLVDPWGADYRYVLTSDELGFDLISDGVDGIAETDDDIHLSKLDEYWDTATLDFDFEMDRYRRGRESTVAEDDDDPGDEEHDEEHDEDDGDDE